MSDQIQVSMDFKLSKNYNSMGGNVGFTSDVKPGETEEQAYIRVYNFVNDKFNEAVEAVDKLFGGIKK